MQMAWNGFGRLDIGSPLGQLAPNATARADSRRKGGGAGWFLVTVSAKADVSVVCKPTNLGTIGHLQVVAADGNHPVAGAQGVVAWW